LDFDKSEVSCGDITIRKWEFERRTIKEKWIWPEDRKK